MGEECKKYHSPLAELIAMKQGGKYSKAIAWVILFSMIRSALLCRRGTRRMKNKKFNMKEIDIEVETEVARIL